MGKKLQTTVMLAVLAGVLLSLGTWVSLQVIIPVREFRFDFYPRWVGAQAFWEGRSPYADEVTDEIQRGMFGDVLPDDPTYDQQNAAYPAYAYLLLAPITALPAQLSIAVWMSLQFFAILASILIWIMISGWRIRSWQFGLVIFSLLFIFRHPINTFVLAQFTGTILLAQSVAAWLLINRRDGWAGVVLACSTVPPTIAAPLALVILLAHVLVGRWRGIVAFLLTMGGLTLASIIQIGWWFPDFLRVLGEYSQYANPVWSPNFIDSTLIRGLFVAGVVAFNAWIIRRFHLQRNVDNQLDVIICLTISGVLLLPQTGSYYMVLLIPALIISLFRARQVRMRWFAILACSLAIFSPWFYAQIHGDAAFIEALLLPLHIGLVWVGVSYPLWLNSKVKTVTDNAKSSSLQGNQI